MEVRSAPGFLGLDLDETLTEGTAHCYPKARREVFAEAGFPFSSALEEEIRKGNLPVTKIVAMLCPLDSPSDQEQSVKRLRSRIQPRYHEMLRACARMRAGAMEVLRRMDHGIVTSSNLGDVNVLCEIFPDLRPHMANVVTSCTIPPGHGKPHPYALLEAEKRRDGRKMYAYVGNELSDMNAAKAHQGIPGILIRTPQTPPDALEAATVIIDDLHELLALFPKSMQDLLSASRIAG